MWSYYLESRHRRFVIREGATIVGRGEDAGIYLDDPTASRRHALLRREGHRLTITDLGSANGTFLNGERVEGTCTLNIDDRIFIGESVFKVVAVHEPGSDRPVTTSVPSSGSAEPAQAGCRHPAPQASTEPYYSSIEVLESLAQSPHAAEEPAALVAMIRGSVDRLLHNMQRRGVVLSDADAERLLAVVMGVAAHEPDHSLDGWVAEVRRKLGR